MVRFELLMMLVKLPGVEYVVPDTVEAADEGSYGSEECISEPYCEHSVLLPHRLTGSDMVAVPVSDPSAEGELSHAADKGDAYEPELG